jgi:hypothetical protein
LINWNYFGGDIVAQVNTEDGNKIIEYPVNVSSNLFKNSGFEKGVKYWNRRVGYPAEADFNLTRSNVPFGYSALSIDVNNLTAFLWDVHLGQSGLYFENGKEYTVSFDTYAETPRTISVIAGMSESTWTVYSGERIFSSLREKRTYSFSFVMNHSTDNQARFGFDLGGSNIDVFFDNIRVSSGTIPVSVYKSPVSPKSFRLYQNYPNPFNPTTIISYELGIKSEVNLSIYSVIGQKVATLASEKQNAGIYTVEWNASGYTSGIYLYRLQTNNGISITKKLVLLR